MRFRERLVQQPSSVEEGAEALQCSAVHDVDGAQDADDRILDALVGVVGEHLEQIVEHTQCIGDFRRQCSRLRGHGASPLPWAHQPQPTASSGWSPRAIPATSTDASE